MTTYPILFNQTPEQLRGVGARGGRARARNWRARRRVTKAAAVPLPRPPVPLMETTEQAIAALHAQFPWLAEKRAASPTAGTVRQLSSPPIFMGRVNQMPILVDLPAEASIRYGKALTG
jgi:hypothetical protein